MEHLTDFEVVLTIVSAIVYLIGVFKVVKILMK